MLTKQLNLKFEEAVRLLVEYAPTSDENTRKALIPHDIRVGVYLYNNNYSEDVIVAGLLHDILEFTDIKEELILEKFGKNVLGLIKANSKNKSILDKNERRDENIKRCVEYGEDALIIKTADILDSFQYYTAVDNKDELEYCNYHARKILELKPENFQDKIFKELNQTKNTSKRNVFC